MEKIAEVFRLYGYEGASVRLLSEATGLERASLYHRFPGGKEQMAASIVAETCKWFERHVFTQLKKDSSPEDKVRRVAANLRDFYRRGALWCVLDTMTLGGGTPAIRNSIHAAYTAWLDAFEQVAREAGMPAPLARSRAQQALIEIEGSLVVARVTGDSKPFLRVVQDLPNLLAKTNHRQWPANVIGVGFPGQEEPFAIERCADVAFAPLETKLFGASPCNDALNLAFTNPHDHVSHDIAEVHLHDFSLKVDFELTRGWNQNATTTGAHVRAAEQFSWGWGL
jgi:TetR/AcrR family transcriptional repressor of lmrAB and yxaGH operons